jgi:hypothetical protein
MAVFDAILTYQFIKKLTTPFNKMPAYDLGLIDSKGNFLKDRMTFNSTQRNALGLFDIMIINLKKLIAKVPGGASRLGTVAATIYLLRSKPIREDISFEDIEKHLEEEFYNIYEELVSVYEDAAPVNTTSGIAGLTPDSLGVPVKAAQRYKKKNIAAAAPIMAALKKRKVMESSLEYHKELNTKIWDNGKLKDEVRGKLLQIAEAWRVFAKIDPSMVQDIIITGGNVNYNYTPQSDIDLHLVIDRNLMFQNRALVDEYLQDKKILWTLIHGSINIYGYPVELYAQDINERPHSGQGVYSIVDNSWLQMPENLNLDFEKDYHLQKKVNFYKSMIDRMIDNKADSGSIDSLKKRIRLMRGDSIAKGGEFAFGNLVFKELRNLGYLDKLNDYEKTMQDKALSLE